MVDDGTKGGPAQRRMTRCADGHVFDAATHAACPTCGARPRAEAAAATNLNGGSDAATRPFAMKAAFAGGAAIVVILMIFALLRGAPADRRAAPATVADAGPGAIDPGTLSPAEDASPAVVGIDAGRPPKVDRWRTVFVIAGKTYECVNETTPEGRYRLGPGCPPPIAGESGVTIVNADGSWSSRSDAGRVDSGTIQVLDADRFIAHTRAGPILWERAKP